MENDLGSRQFEGTTFLLSYTPVQSNPATGLERGYLYVTANHNGTSCNVTSGTSSSTILVDISWARYILPETNNVSTAGIKQKSAVEISCTGFVQLYVLFKTESGYSEAFGVRPVSSLSTDYIVPSVTLNPTLSIAAASDNTAVTVLFSSNCFFSYENNIYADTDNISVLLNKRDVFHIAPDGAFPNANSSNLCDYHGTRVLSTSPVAVFSGSGTLGYPKTHGDKILDQVPPVSSLGNDYVIPPLDHTDSYQVRIIAPVSNTSITLTDGSSSYLFSLQSGQTHVTYYNPDAVVVLTSSQPIIVQRITGSDATYTVFSSIVPPINRYGHAYTIPDVQGYNGAFVRYLSIIIDSNCTNQISINSGWRNISVRGHQYSVTTLRAPASLNRLNTTPECRFAVQVYGLGSAEGYGYFAVPISDGTSNENNLLDAFTLVCETNNWVVEVNKDTFVDKFNRHSFSNIYVSTEICHGVSRGNSLVFNYTYTDCNTHMQENDTDYIFTNYLVEYHIDPLTHLADGVLWRYDIQCLRPRHEVDFVTISPVDVSNAIHVQSSSKVSGQQAEIRLFTDSSFTNQMTGDRLTVNVGARVYVQVQTKGTASVKLLVDNCHVSPDNKRDISTMVSLIQDRCESNHFVHILGSADKVTRFYFDMFEIPHTNDFVYVTCDVSFCDVMDFSNECQHGCLQTKP
ncbi:uncharacterized protein [Haliotis cracherodii]|uniref:uncharacterized protein n=1 Tax=Haliotis cracherodii TaxID=6455 RepID=UPI0039EA9B59